MENHVMTLGVVGAVHVCSGNQHLRDGPIVHNILIVLDNYVVMKICQWDIQGVAMLVKAMPKHRGPP